MKKNMGKFDRVLRVLVAVVIGTLFATGVLHGTLGIILVVLAAIFLLTSLIGTCPLYMPFGLSSCKKQESA